MMMTAAVVDRCLSEVDDRRFAGDLDHEGGARVSGIMKEKGVVEMKGKETDPVDFQDDNDQKLHYKSEWHRYNLKRKIAGVPGVTEALFLARQASLAEEKSKLNGPAMTYTCRLCGKGYRSAKAHAQHLKSRTHTMRVSQTGQEDEDNAVIKPLVARIVKKPAQEEYDDESDGSDEWVEVTENDDLVGEMGSSSAHMEVNESPDTDEDSGEDMDEDEEELDPTCCFMCDKEHKTIESCMVHLHKHHGFFVPDIEYLKDPTGFLTYLGLKGRFEIYVDANGKQLVSGDGTSNAIELGSGGAELIITTRSDDTISTKAIGSREYLRYYRQRPSPSATGVPMTALLAARYRSMGLSTVQSKENMVRMKVMKQMNRNGVDFMRSKMGMKSNVIRNLPKNVPH
ncbi:cytoplasmic 60S subunit biogenesis factor REI1 homolog 1-like protein [Tanacetum coccineum]|uniref:Cytoplasmic 60S subunit biogenesis factor REI1 homolog 1-like protein n=1 Tax=Tanacetum coccineum TaxID=301880 RepID=A0ABQ5G3E5_9ASTR